MRANQMALACDGGMMLLFEMGSFDKMGQITVQREDVTALTYVRDDIILSGEVLGFFDVASIKDGNNVVTHSLQIEQAGDVNCMT